LACLRGWLLDAAEQHQMSKYSLFCSQTPTSARMITDSCFDVPRYVPRCRRGRALPGSRRGAGRATPARSWQEPAPRAPGDAHHPCHVPVCLAEGPSKLDRAWARNLARADRGRLPACRGHCVAGRRVTCCRPPRAASTPRPAASPPPPASWWQTSGRWGALLRPLRTPPGATAPLVSWCSRQRDSF